MQVPSFSTPSVHSDPLLLTGRDAFAILVSIPEIHLTVAPEKGPASGVRRARRFLAGVPLQYRLATDREWHGAVTENLSMSGILFRTARTSLSLRGPETDGRGVPVEMVPDLPARLEVPARTIRCEGKVVRSKPTDNAQAITVAVALRGYYL